MRATGTRTTSGTDRGEERNALLRESFEGEVLGCAMYDAMVASAVGNRKATLQLLHELERVTVEALEPLMSRYGVEADVDAVVGRGRHLADELMVHPWVEMWHEVVRLADKYLGVFTRLAELLDPDDARVGAQVVAHEKALIEFAGREIDGDADSVEPLRQYLQRYTCSATASAGNPGPRLVVRHSNTRRGKDHRARQP
jgi:hypothetical protein